MDATDGLVAAGGFAYIFLRGIFGWGSAKNGHFFVVFCGQIVVNLW
jgi:hypothetical protein